MTSSLSPPEASPSPPPPPPPFSSEPAAAEEEEEGAGAGAASGKKAKKGAFRGDKGDDVDLGEHTFDDLKVSAGLVDSGNSLFGSGADAGLLASATENSAAQLEVADDRLKAMEELTRGASVEAGDAAHSPVADVDLFAMTEGSSGGALDADLFGSSFVAEGAGDGDKGGGGAGGEFNFDSYISSENSKGSGGGLFD